MQGVASWQRVVDCFVGNTVDPIKLAMQSGQEGQEVMELASRLNTNSTQLKESEKIDLPAQVVPHTAGLGEAIVRGSNSPMPSWPSHMSRRNGRSRDV